MVEKIRIVSVATLVALSVPSFAAEPTDWTLERCVDAEGVPTRQIADGAKCDLVNRKSGSCLVRVSHSGQVDWDFASCASKPRQLKVSGANPGPIACGDRIAIKLGSEYFRKCVNPQQKGINICSEGASEPEPRHFDWRLEGCTGPLLSGKPVALVNVSRKDSVVYAKRSGDTVDTCWSDSMKFGQCMTFRDR